MIVRKIDLAYYYTTVPGKAGSTEKTQGVLSAWWGMYTMAHQCITKDSRLSRRFVVDCNRQEDTTVKILLLDVFSMMLMMVPCRPYFTQRLLWTFCTTLLKTAISSMPYLGNPDMMTEQRHPNQSAFLLVHCLANNDGLSFMQFSGDLQYECT